MLAIQRQRLDRNLAYSRALHQQILLAIAVRNDRQSFEFDKVSTFEGIHDAFVNDLLCLRVKL